MNASAPLKIIALDDCWENVHPDVAYMPKGFGGYPYWMVFTPYPSGNARLENPTIRASHDGVHWQRVHGIRDPLVPAPSNSDMHHADPEIMYSLGRLHVIYLTIHFESKEVTFNVMSCKNDFRWSEPQVIHEDVGTVSPTFSIEGNIWHVWFIRINASKESSACSLVHREGPDLACLENERPCHLEIPHHVPWHVDIQRVKEGYEALIAAFPHGTNSSRTRLFHLFSEDGLTFSLSSKNPIIAPSFLGWDNRMIYRASFLKNPDGNYRIWYSASSWGLHFGIGLLQGSLDSLSEPAAPLASVPHYIVRFPGEVVERVKYEAVHHLPSPLVSIGRRVYRGI